jgi:hypothetical protein
MRKHSTLVLATLAMSAAAFAQPPTFEDGPYQIGYAAHLNSAHGLVSGAIVNLSNDGALAGFYPNTGGAGNICANVYVMDAQEEELACCSCLITPNGLANLSTGDLINNLLTPTTVDSIVIKLVATVPATAVGVGATICNAGTVTTTSIATGTAAGDLTNGLLAWGITLEPTITGTAFAPVTVPFFQGSLNIPAAAGVVSELTSLVNVCNFIRGDGSGSGLCSATCQYPGGTSVGALSGAKH